MNKSRTDVVISFDIEFDINNAFTPPFTSSPRGKESLYVFNNSKDLGLGYILDTLDTHQLKATFFIETCNAAFFGSSPMGEVANDIYSRGHDVQLHLHPAWEIFLKPDWQDYVSKNSPKSALHDNLGQLDHKRQVELIRKGISLFEQWGLPKPVALRAGNLFSGSTTYQAMRETDMLIASNIGMGIHVPEEEELHLYTGVHIIDGILEAPVTSFCDIALLNFVHTKLATVIGMSFAEMKQLLDKLEARNINPAVFLSHVSEFIQNYTSGATPNATVCRRFDSLCHHLSSNRDRFNTRTFSDACTDWKNQGSGKNELVSTSFFLALMRGLS